MLDARPGACAFIGSRDGAPLRRPGHGFAEAAIRHGIACRVKLVETAPAP